VGAAAVLLAVAAAAISWAITDRAVIVVESDDPRAEVEVDQNKLILHDRGAGRSYLIGVGAHNAKAGTYEIEVSEKGQASGLRLSTRQFTITHNGKAVIRVRLEPHGPLDRLAAKTIPDDRRFPWQPAELVGVLGQVRPGHFGAVQCIAFHPDGKLAASGGYGGGVRLWDVPSGRELFVFKGRHRVVSLVFLADRQTLAFVSGQEVHFVDLKRRIVRDTWPLGGDVTGLALSPDGKTLAAAVGVWADQGMPGKVVLREVASGKQLASLPHTGQVYGMAFAPNGNTLATSDFGKQLHLWDCQTYRERVSPRKLVKPLRRLVFAADGLSLGGSDGKVKQVGLDGTEKAAFLGQAALGFSADGKSMLIQEIDRVEVWNLLGKKEQTLLRQKWSTLVSSALSADGRTLAVGSRHGQVTFVEVEAGKQRTAEVSNRDTASLAVSADGRVVARGLHDGGIVIEEVATGRTRTVAPGHTGEVPFPGHTDRVIALAFSPDGRLLASGSADNTVRFWDLATLEEQTVWTASQVGVPALAFSPDGKTLAAIGGNVKRWDVKARKELSRFDQHTSQVQAIAFSPDGARLASGDFHGHVHVWDTTTGKVQTTLPKGERRISGLAFSSDGRSLFAAELGGPVRQWDLIAGKELARLDCHGGRIQLAPGPDARLMPVVAQVGAVVLWQPGVKETPRTVAFPGELIGLGAPRDGRHLLTGNAHGAVFVLRLPAPK
jgi:WD40 repeat protein